MLATPISRPFGQRSFTSIALSVSVGALIALAACDPAASPSSTAAATAETAASAAAKPLASIVGGPASTPGPIRPAGVPANAQPLLFGCAEDPARCSDFAPGTYYTAGEWAFLPGLTFTLPAGWSSLSNDAADLELHRTGDDRNEIIFWRDVVPWQDGHAAVDLALDPEAWVARLTGDPCLEVSEPERVVLGRWTDLRVDQLADLQAIAVSVGITAAPAYDKAGCPGDGRVAILSDPIHWGDAFTIGGDELNEPGCPCSSVQRLYFASIGYASHPHLLVVVLQSYGPDGTRESEMASLQAAAQPILDSLIAPAIVVDN